MRYVIAALILVFLAPASLSAGSLRCTLPPEIPVAYLLSGGTQAVIEHYKAQSDAEIAELSRRYRIDALAAEVKKAEELLIRKNQAYADRLASLREKYLSSLEISLEAADASVSPSSSALGDLEYFYTARNKSDKIVTDITYRPLIRGINLPTTTSLVLEFIHPRLMVSGIGPGETMTNRGHEPERFSFFISELSKDEINALKKDAAHLFSIEIIDMHFADRKGYKGQIEIQDFVSAFPNQLKPLLLDIKSAEAELKARRDSLSRATASFNSEKDRVLEDFRKSLAGLRKTSVRSSARPDKKNRFLFDNVPSGTYYLYAGNGRGSAVFEKVVIDDENRQEAYTDMKKDPFAP